MVNTRKLVVTFLILAGLTGGIIWFFSGLKSSNQLALGTQNFKIATIDGSLLDRNNPNSSGKTNLTELMAKNLAEKVILNEAGYPPSSTESSADNQLKSEEVMSLMQESISNLTPIAEENLKVIKSDTIQDRLVYIRAVNEILKTTVGGTQLDDLTREPMNLEMAKSKKSGFEQAIANLLNVPTPKSLLPAHQKLLTFLNQYQKILSAVIDYESDPVKTIVLLDINDALSQYNLQNFQEELKKLPPPSATPTSLRSPSFIDKILGIKVAYALPIPGLSDYVPVDCSGDACSDLFATEVDATNEVTKAIKELVNISLTQLGHTKVNEELKNKLVKSIERQAIDYVQGASTPKYVQNWQTETGSASDRASEAVIKKTTPELCPSFNSVTKLALGDGGVMMNGSSKNCSLDKVVKNTDAFYNDLSKGGWPGYFEALKPQNNLHGSIIIVGDKAEAAGVAAAEAARSEAESGQGFRSTKTCVNRSSYTIDDLKERGVMEPGVITIKPGEETFYANMLGEDYIEGTFSSTGFDTCQRDGWQITTPGNVTGQILNNSLALSGQRINSSLDSRDSSTLTTVLTDSSQNRLIRAEERGPDNNGILDVYRARDPAQLNDPIQGPLALCLRMAAGSKERSECVGNNISINTLRNYLDNPASLKTYVESYVRNYINKRVAQIEEDAKRRLLEQASKIAINPACDLIPSSKAKLACKIEAIGLLKSLIP